MQTQNPTSASGVGQGTTTVSPVKILVVDDSPLMRSIISRTLRAEKDFNVAGTAVNGQLAVDFLRAQPVDVIILDIEMPVMDGLTAIPLLKKAHSGAQIIMASTLTKKNAEISLKALSLGASDYIPKPSTDEALGISAEFFNRELVQKVRAFGTLAQKRAARLSASAPVVAPASIEKKKIVLRPAPMIKPDIIAIGSSTGGPQALFEVIKSMGTGLPQPIVITQHMPPSFTTILAEHISRQCNVTCREGKDGEVIQFGHYYIAPGDFHMQIVKGAAGATIKLTKDAPENYCRPSVDPMLRSLVDVYGKKVLTVILTGMGQDGLKGSEIVVNAGGCVMAQDEATSVVWGMPAAVANAGICSSVLPIKEIGAVVRQFATKAIV